jgi:hypothetical protein
MEIRDLFLSVRFVTDLTDAEVIEQGIRAAAGNGMLESDAREIVTTVNRALFEILISQSLDPADCGVEVADY